MNSGQTLFSGQAQVAQKSWMIKKYFNSVKNSRATVFRASASCSKILNVKNIFNTVKNCRATLFFRASASCSKILNVKSIFDTVKIFRAHSVFQGKRKLLKNPECKKYIQYSEFRATLFLRASTKLLKNPEWWKVYSIQWKISGQAQVAKKPWTVKKFSIQCAFTWGWSVQFGLV